MLTLITKDRERLTNQIAARIHENSNIATGKFKFLNWAIRAELVAVAVLVCTVDLVVVGS